jgi:hypothetical protein
MKIVTVNERTPRRYSKFRTVSLCDDQGMVWGRISIRQGSINVEALDGVHVNVQQTNGMGDWDLENEFNRSWRWGYECPQCQSRKKSYDRLRGCVTCQDCGAIWGRSE